VVAGPEAEAEEQALDQGAVSAYACPAVANQAEANGDAVLVEEAERVDEVLHELVDRHRRAHSLERNLYRQLALLEVVA
jgi:hypothetical protein